MRSFVEPLILYWVLFLRVSSGAVLPGEPIAFSTEAEIARIVLYTVPSLALLWYLMLKAKNLKEWGIALPQKKDLVPTVIAFPALLLIGLTISLVAPNFDGISAAPKFLPPQSTVSWVILVFSCFSAAYLEESYFRLYLLSKREEMGLGPHRAVLVSTLLFSFCHAYEGPWGFLNSALSGILLAFIFLRYQSLHGIAIPHALYNILAYALGAMQRR